MNRRIVPFSLSWLEGIRSLNRQFDSAGVHKGFRLPEAFPAGSGTPLESASELPFEQRQFLILDNDCVAGGFMLQEQSFVLCGQTKRVTNIQAPISAGAVDRKFAALGGWMMRAILQSHPLVFALGMGNADLPFPRLLKALRWDLQPVPFQFRVQRPARFLRQIPALRTTAARRWAATLGAITGVGAAAIEAAQWAQRLRNPREVKAMRRVIAEPASTWGSWADGIWANYGASCSLAAVRDCQTLRLFQPSGAPRFEIFTFRCGGQVVGWASIQTRQMSGSPHFGDLRVKTVLDAVCIPGWEHSVAFGVVEVCSSGDADLIVSNQQRAAWLSAFRFAGFLNGPSNYLLGLSPALTAEMEPLSARRSSIHMSRADADGRWHL